MRLVFTITTIYFAISLLAVNANAQVLKDGYTASIISEGLNPVAMTADHHGRLWLAEKDGRVLIVNEEGVLQVEPFIDIDVDEFNERGLMGIVLHPDIENQPYLYLYYTVPLSNHNRVSRFRISGNFAVPGSEEIILELDKLSGAIHNGGAMIFDKHGYLFIATGEAGLSSNSQDTGNLLGKILRVTDEGEIPSDNPYFNELEGNNKAIWSFGHRNPFNLAYDYEKDILYASDVGAGEYEEINLIEKGNNYGWPIIEGPIGETFPPENYKDPYFSYDHSEGCAIVGLAYINAENNFLDKEISNSIVYADYCKGYVNYLKNGNITDIESMAFDIERPLNILFNEHLNSLFIQTRSGLGGGSQEDNTSTSTGKLWKLSYSGNGIPQFLNAPKDKTIAKGESTFFSIQVVGSRPFTFDWYINETLYATTLSDTLFLPDTSELSDVNTLYCIVSNDEGRDTSSTFQLVILNNTRPRAVIISPAAGSNYTAGDTINFAGYINDDEDGLLSADHYEWTINFHHDLHSHPFIESISGVGEGSFVLPTVGEPDTNVWIRISLSGRDLSGLSTSTSANVFPAFNNILIASNFGGSVNIDGVLERMPFELKSTINLERIIEVPSQQEVGDYLLLFSNWENGSTERLRKFSVRENEIDTLLIFFDTIRLGSGEGLYAEYFNDFEKDLDGDAALVRIDSMINFRWGDKSPLEDVIDKDNFSIRWRGFLEPLFDEEYELSFQSDDGSRIWLDDELILDDWTNHPPKEHTLTMNLESKRKYKLVIEYFESGGGAEAELRWSSPSTRKSYIPKRQLFPMEFGSFHGRIWYDINRDGEIQDGEPYTSDVSIVLLDENNEVIHFTTTNADGFFAFLDFEIGRYRVLIIPANDYLDKDYGFGLNDEGYSSFFTITADGLIEDKFALIDNVSSHTSDNGFEKIIVFPNPLRNRLFFKNLDFELREVRIFGLDGKLYKHLKADQLFGSIDFDDIVPGNYLVQLVGKKQSYILKVMKI